MGAVFVKILNMSLTAGWIVLAVLLVRLLFKKKAPKALFPILWALVAVRLICPVTFESSFSLIRNPEPMTEETLFSEEPARVEPPTFLGITDPEKEKKFAEDYQTYIDGLEKQSEKVIVSVVSGPIDTENPDAVDYFIQEIDPEETKLPNEIMEELESHGSYTETTEDGVTNTYTLVHSAEQAGHKPSVYVILGTLWLVGVVGMLFYMLFSYLRIFRKVKESALYEKNVRRCDSIDSPFILGVIRPRIYLPSDISESDRDYVLAHERAHLKRLDYIWKPLGFLLLSVYWFHPLLWVAYILLCKDIEFACDEKVIKELGIEQKKAYSTALINCSVSRKMISACPLAFGENGVKGRIKSVLHYKKPAFWIMIVSVVACTVLAVCFLTNPEKKAELPKPGDIITFGTYEQDNVSENGAEPIEWIVVDVFDGTATLLSKYGLDAKPYHEVGTKGIYWADCSLRSWLNSEFFSSAFSEKERKNIISTRLENHSSSSYNVKDGIVTEDKIYLLSIDELYRIFKPEGGIDESEYRSKAGITTLTAYAKAQGAWEGKTEDGTPAGPWLLRTLGVNYTSVCRVDTNGKLSLEVSNDYSGCAIRPAMRISLDHAEYEIISGTASEEETENTDASLHTRSGRFVDTVSLTDAKPGYVVEFGVYEQNKDTNDGAEPIEWYVLDVKDDKALLLSKYVLENMPYHKYEEEITWKNCTLREWLNGTFYENAFNAEEKQRIATTLLENVWNPWNVLAEYEYTEDKVFLPSMEDMLSGDYFYTEKAPESAAFTFDGYFQTDAERMVRGVYEEEQLTHNASGSVNDFDGMPYAAYWLRASSRVEYRSYDEKKENPYLVVAGISFDGSLDTTAYNTIGNTYYDEKGVRPAIWVELGDLDEIADKNAKKNKENDKKGSLFLSSRLPDRYKYKEVKEALSEYLNHQAYLYPAEHTQEKWESTFDVYSTTDSKMKRVYLQVNENGKEMWYLCTPTVYLDEEAPLTILPMDAESVESLLSLGAITHLGTDKIKMPASSAPEYHKNTDVDVVGYKESIALICDELCKNGYLRKDEKEIDVIKLEAWISEFDMEKKLYPHAYIIINDSFVYETSFTKYKGLYASFCSDNFSKDFSLQEHFEERISYVPEEFDGRSIVPLASVDKTQLERVKSCAVLHYVHEPDFSVTITVEGKEITLPKQNVEIDVQTDIGIAFVPQEIVGDISRYSIYRTTDGGKNWNPVVKFETEARELAAIKVPDEAHVVCYFNLIGSTYHSTCYFSEDGGVTWTMPEQADKPKVDLSDAAVGTSVIFGSYEQDFELENGKEPIEWLVLDRVEDKVLLLSRFGLLSELYDLSEFDSWEDCRARRYLNEYFYVDAFSQEERKRIVKTANSTPNMTGDELVTEEFVFLLSESEVLEGKTQDGTPYFKDDAARMTLPTPRKSSAWIYSNCESSWWGNINVNWLLRAGEDKMYNSWVNEDGTVNKDSDYIDYDSIGVLTRPAIWVDLSGLSGNSTGSSVEKEDTQSVTGPLVAAIETTDISIAIGDEYAAYLDEDGKVHVLYDTSYRSDNDTVGATGGIDTSKTYKALGTDSYRLVAIDEDGKLSVSYHMTAEELTEYCNQVAKDAADNGGTYGLGGPQDGIARDFEEMSGVRQVFSTYPYSGYTALCDDGYVYPRSKGTEPFADIVQIAEANGHIMGLKADGTLVMTEVSDVLRKKKLESWPEKLKQIAAGYNFFVGLKLDGTVISEGVEQEYLINTIEQWSGIVKIAVANETVVGLKGDGTVVAVCPARSDKGQCEVDDWTNVIAVNTNGSVTIGITKDGTVLMVGDVPEIVKNLPERYNYEEIKSVFLEYLNHQAWLYPSQYPQESYTCTYELYSSAKDVNTKYVYLKTVIKDTEYWVEFKPEKYYVATSPTRIVAQRTDIMRERLENGEIVSIGSDKVYVPATKKPAYGNPVDLTNEISSIYSDLKRNGYRDNLKIEVIVSEHDLEKNLYPYTYLIINDSEVFETSFGELEGNLYSFSMMFFYGNYSKDYTIDYTDGWMDVFDGHGIKPLDAIDKMQFERVKACAVIHQIYTGNSTETFLIDGQPIEIGSPNLGMNEAIGVRIAFLPQEAAAGSVYYNIYRSDDRGNSWRMVAEDFVTSEGDIARILIPEKDTVVCWFEISGTTSQSSCFVSEDGGITWKDAPYTSKPNSFTYDPQKDRSIIFGAYEQDGDYNNGKEPLEWLVLDRDGDRALLLSKYGIETLLWDKDKVLEPWKVDDLYWMMNRTLYEDAFSAKERAVLIQTNPIKHESLDEYPYGMLQYPGYTFLLETDDVLYGQGQDETRYFRTEESRITIPTAYAAEKGAWLDKNVMFTDVAVPWIVTVTGTTDGDFSEVQFARVMPDGSISFEEEAIKEQHVLIRPAIWVDVTKLSKP